MDENNCLVSISLDGFQSYRHLETVAFDPVMTLVAGRNDVGKSALLRAMRVFAEPSVTEGARAEFQITYRWRIPADELVGITSNVATTGHPDWLQSREFHTLAVTCRLGRSPGERGAIRAEDLVPIRLELVELELLAEGNPGTNLGWSNGPFNGSATLTDRLTAAAHTRASAIAYLAPRRIQSGERATLAAPVLTPTGDNLLEVVYGLQTNQPTTGYRELLDFLRAAFPQIEVITARSSQTSSSAELHVIYRGSPELIPLSQCGTGIEQMVALGASILTQRAPRVFLIDEPQAYLHPHAERSLEAFLAQHEQHQYVIATHSSVFLTRHPLAATRLVTITDGASTVVQPGQASALLDELGVTAADLWLAERVLWVEGPTEVEVIARVMATLQDPQVQSIQIRAMPVASRFASRSERGAQDTFEFLRKVVEAITPLSVSMRFLFDSDEKSEVLKARIAEASGERAHFLPVRELENLLIDAPSIHELLAERCQQADVGVPSLEDIQGARAELLTMHDDRDLYPRGMIGGKTEEQCVVGSEVLNRLYERFLRTEYRKVRDGASLAAIVARNAPARFEPLLERLRELAEN